MNYPADPAFCHTAPAGERRIQSEPFVDFHWLM
jgi:hypothetical protein